MICRDEGILILSGGLTLEINHPSLQILHALCIRNLTKRYMKQLEWILWVTLHCKKLQRLTENEDHFIPLYVAAGGGEKGKVWMTLDHQQSQVVCLAVPLIPPPSPKPSQNIGNIDSMITDNECTTINPD